MKRGQGGSLVSRHAGKGLAKRSSAEGLKSVWQGRLKAYLPAAWFNCDHEGSWPRWRPGHCTWVRLMPTIVPNVRNSGGQFLLVGDCVRAIPF